MALISCPECNKQISDKATSCPNCGFPIKSNIVEWDIEDERQKEKEKRIFVDSLEEIKSLKKNHSRKKKSQGSKENGLSWTNFFWILAVTIIVLIIVLIKTDNEDYNYSSNSYSQKNYNLSNVKIKYSVRTLNVREKSDEKSKVLKTLKLNEKVLTAGNVQNGFITILKSDSSFLGWCADKYLKDSPLSKNQVEKAEKKKEELKESQQNAWKNKLDKVTAHVMAREFVEQSLKSPGSAKYPWESSDDVTTYLGNQIYIVKSYVDSQNGFGALIRTNFTVKLEQTSNENWTLLDIDFY